MRRKIRFEEMIDIISREISKRRSKWQLKAISWMDFDDVAQIILIHIHNKWSQWDQTRDLLPWMNRIISNQFKNILRNVYHNISRPCLSCERGTGVNCEVYEEDNLNKCPLYLKWYKTKKLAHDIRMPLPIENHSREVFRIPHDDINIGEAFKKVHHHMKLCLKPNEWKVYEGVYLKHKPEEQVANEMGYKTTEVGRSAGYKRIKQLKKIIIIKAQKIIKEHIS